MREEAQAVEGDMEEEEHTPAAVPTPPEVENGQGVTPTTAVVGNTNQNHPPRKRPKLEYDEWSMEDLIVEMKRRRKKPGNMGGRLWQHTLKKRTEARGR